MRKQFDLIVIGSGPGGTQAALHAAMMGKSVAIIEKGKSGGSCVHSGTIPSKSLREETLRLSKTEKKRAFSLAQSRMKKVVTKEAAATEQKLAEKQITLLQGTASFLSPHEIEVTQKKQKLRFTANRFVVATGTRPIRHKDYPFELKGLFDSDSLLEMKRLPKRFLIMGAGVIGCEYASIFARLGCQLTLVDRRKELLRMVDGEIVAALQECFKKERVKVLLGCELGKISKAKGGLSITINRKRSTFDGIFVCMGREPNVEELSPSAAGIKLDERNYIQVNKQTYQTSVPHIYAVGDVIGAPGLAATAFEQGRIAAHQAFGDAREVMNAHFPTGIYTIPEISSVGLQEAELLEKKMDYVVGKADFSRLARGILVGEESGFLKLLVDREKKTLLGIHAIGTGASEIVHIGQILYALGTPIDFLIKNVFNFPTFAEAYKIAAQDAWNRL